ncbi:methyltransferase family 23, putative [Bodo saltans]|uniref:Methyltransferase family 23, putative n=1 Tax=Bodo saltans TaxID=75058 RepID=A0A0S4ISJ6_BODSA|nr:methyltransferase family 23, putative [Bodo saltans]|eukprot:CUF66753.1 methyltransferase family 23, putative [Bodo saltans]
MCDGETAEPIKQPVRSDEGTETEQSVKRTRRGEKFTPANEVNLHGNDFEWVDLLKELSSEDLILYQQIRQKCSEKLQRVHNELISVRKVKKCADCFYPLGHDNNVGVLEVTPTSEADAPSPASVPAQCSSAAAEHTHDPQSWERHYMTNKQHFPVKNYIVHAFPSLIPRMYPGQSHKEALDALCGVSSTSDASQQPPPPPALSYVESVGGRVVMEAGCGTGSVTHPLMKLFPKDTFICHDVSGTAVDILRSHDVSKLHVAQGGQLETFVLDLSRGGHALTAAVEEYCMHSLGNRASKGNTDFILLVFVLSAMPSLQHMVHALRQLRSYLRPVTGRLLFRDYGALDHNFFRFHRQDNMFLESSLNFLKGDGTEQFFYDIETVHELFALSGLAPASETVYHCNRIVNRKNGKRMDKVFVNGEFCVAPLPEDASDAKDLKNTKTD